MCYIYKIFESKYVSIYESIFIRIDQFVKYYRIFKKREQKTHQKIVQNPQMLLKEI